MNMKQTTNEAQAPTSHFRYGRASCIIFGLTLLVWLGFFTAFESLFVGLSPTMERWLGIVTLLLPSVVGMVLGGIGRAKPPQNKLLALIGLLLNTMLLVFFTFILALAG